MTDMLSHRSAVTRQRGVSSRITRHTTRQLVPCPWPWLRWRCHCTMSVQCNNHSYRPEWPPCVAPYLAEDGGRRHSHRAVQIETRPPAPASTVQFQTPSNSRSPSTSVTGLTTSATGITNSRQPRTRCRSSFRASNWRRTLCSSHKCSHQSSRIPSRVPVSRCLPCRILVATRRWS